MKHASRRRRIPGHAKFERRPVIRPEDDIDTVEGQIRDMGPDEDDVELLRHVTGETENSPPQGLHRGGFKDRTNDDRLWEDDAMEQWNYPNAYDDLMA